MGLHRHVRVCIDMNKVRSAGGDEYRWIAEDLNKGLTNFVRDHVCHVPDDGKPHTITGVFIKRHHNHANRTIERIVTFTVRKADTGVEVISEVDRPFDIKMSYDDPRYPDIQRAILFEVVKSWRSTVRDGSECT